MRAPEGIGLMFGLLKQDWKLRGAKPEDWRVDLTFLGQGLARLAFKAQTDPLPLLSEAHPLQQAVELIKGVEVAYESS